MDAYQVGIVLSGHRRGKIYSDPKKNANKIVMHGLGENCVVHSAVVIWR
jgi:hypothetical protein